MTKLTELLKEKEELKNVINSLKNEGKINEAHSKLEELRMMNKQIEIEEIEKKEIKEMKGEKNMSTNIKPINVLSKLLTGRTVTEEEKEVYLNSVGTPGQAEHTPTKGGYLVPIEQVTEILEFKRELNSLKNICDVIPVHGMEGVMPTEVEGTGELIAFEELNAIRESDIDFAQLKWSVADYGDIIPVSNTLLADEKANLISFIKSRFSKKAVNTENKKIIELIKTASVTQAGTDIGAIGTALNTKLDVALRAGAIILCNQSTFDWLDSKLDGQNRPLLTPDVTNPTIMRYKGLPIMVVNDTLLAPAGGNKKDFYLGNFSEFLKFFDRQGLEIAVSTEAGFNKNATLLRVIERFDVKIADTKAVVKVQITTTD